MSGSSERTSVVFRVSSEPRPQGMTRRSGPGRDESHAPLGRLLQRILSIAEEPRWRAMVTAPSDCSSSAQISRRYEVLNVTPRSFQPLFGRRSTDERPRVLHVIEASLGGTGHYMADVLAAGVDAETGLVYSSRRADLAFGSFLERAAQAGWKLYDVEMEREIRPLRDL